MNYELEKIKCDRLSGIVYLDTVDSTNLEAKRRAAQGAKDGTLVLTGIQSAGRGRLGRVWNNNGEEAIAMSLLLRPNISPDKVSMITIIAALAVRRGIENTCGLSCDVKWPNDLKYKDKKLVGILSESTFCGQEFYTVLGIGINVNNDSFPKELKDIAGSIRLALANEGKPVQSISREDIITRASAPFMNTMIACAGMAICHTSWKNITRYASLQERSMLMVN